jgi:hypothetical protein
MDACNIDGSLSAVHTAAGDAGITRLLVISMRSVSGGVSRTPTFAS